MLYEILSKILHEPTVPIPVDTVVPDTFESCLDAIKSGNDNDFRNGLKSLEKNDMMTFFRFFFLIYFT